MIDIKKIDEISTTVERELGSLNVTQLNWKFSPDSWSIAQCIDHIIVSNEKYFPTFENVISGKYKMSFWERNNPLTSYTGKQMILTLGPVITKKYKSPKLFQPSYSTISVSIISDFMKHQIKLMDLFSSLSDSKYDKVIITSPVAALLSLKLRDAEHIISVHEERHLQQMIRVKEQMGK